MNAKAIWYWLLAALVLSGLVLLHEKFGRPKPADAPAAVLPNFKASTVSKVIVRPRDKLEIRAERADGGWKLTEPLAYPAQATAVEALLSGLEKLTPAAYITARERANRPTADEEDGFVPPQATITVEGGNARTQIWVGSRTAPGDQVFLQIVGVDGVYVADSALLSLIPDSGNNWRDTSLVNLNQLSFDRIVITNGSRVLELKKEGAAMPWRMISPIQARADEQRIDSLLQKLGSLKVEEFVTDDPKADLEAFGLQPPDLQVALAGGSNIVTALAAGKSPTNDLKMVYARSAPSPSVVKVAKDLLDGWHIASINDFRDPHLLSCPDHLDAIEVKGPETFTLQQQSSNSWRVLPDNFPADADLIREFLTILSTLKIVEFSKDVVTPPALPTYGLAEPVLHYALLSRTNAPGTTNHLVYAALDFGTNSDAKVYVRRLDESSVYAIAMADFARLPTHSAQFRDRQVWNFSEEEITGVSIRQEGRVRQLIRKGKHEWSLAPGSSGVINPLAIEETVRMLGRLSVVSWVGRGESCCAAVGITPSSHQITLELKDGRKAAIGFAPLDPARPPIASIVIDGQPWVFVFPASLFPFISAYLTLPAGTS